MDVIWRCVAVDLYIMYITGWDINSASCSSMGRVKTDRERWTETSVETGFLFSQQMKNNKNKQSDYYPYSNSHIINSFIAGSNHAFEHSVAAQFCIFMKIL